MKKLKFRRQKRIEEKNDLKEKLNPEEKSIKV